MPSFVLIRPPPPSPPPGLPQAVLQEPRGGHHQPAGEDHQEKILPQHAPQGEQLTSNSNWIS